MTSISDNLQFEQHYLFLKLVFYSGDVFVFLIVCKMADKEFAQKKILITGVGGGKVFCIILNVGNDIYCYN